MLVQTIVTHLNNNIIKGLNLLNNLVPTYLTTYSKCN